MKCIQATKETKYSKAGEIVRVKDSEANEKVETGYWKFINKSEWKKSIKPAVSNSEETTKKSSSVIEKGKKVKRELKNKTKK